jgi:hypothetical protein
LGDIWELVDPIGHIPSFSMSMLNSSFGTPMEETSRRVCSFFYFGIYGLWKSTFQLETALGSLGTKGASPFLWTRIEVNFIYVYFHLKYVELKPTNSE